MVAIFLDIRLTLHVCWATGGSCLDSILISYVELDSAYQNNLPADFCCEDIVTELDSYFILYGKEQEN